LHALIFGGFVVLLTALVEEAGRLVAPGFSLDAIGGSTWIALLQDVFEVAVLVGVCMAAYNRWARRPARFRGSNQRDAAVILALIFCEMVSLLLHDAFRIGQGGDAAAGWQPVASALARLIEVAGVHDAAAAPWAGAFFWAHVTALLVFLPYIATSKHLHIATAVPNLYFRNLGPRGALRPVDPGGPAVGVGEVDQLSWKQMLDLYACTECGRCQDACPAFAAGQPLSPKVLIMDVRNHLRDRGRSATRKAAGGAVPQLLGDVVRDETLWACTTCTACMEVCPLHIEHVPLIVDMRRRLVEEGRMEPPLQDALASLARHGNSFNRSERARSAWTRDLGFPVKDARTEPVDVLWFVGDYAAYDPRVQELTRGVARVLHRAGVDYGILYEAERNSGNDVRRVGEEGLFEQLARHNIETLGRCSFRRIMTADPHSLNALAQEYPGMGGRYPVLHYTQLLLELVERGALAPAPHPQVVTYHDPCYLGRYNQGYDAPRRLLERLGVTLHEMPRCREASFCCGAGGGRIWMDDSGQTERPSESRIREAVALGDAHRLVVACPKDMVMFTAAVQATGMAGRMEVVDVIELVEASLTPEEVAVAVA
jgi:Fe-S oxidoreductase